MSTDTMETGILEAIDAIRPALQADGGDIVFKDVDDAGVVHVELVGACGTCPVSTMTLKAGSSGSSWTGCRASPKSSPTDATRPWRSTRPRS